MMQSDLDHIISELDKCIKLQNLLKTYEECRYNDTGAWRHRHIARGLVLAKIAIRDSFLSDGTPIENSAIYRAMDAVQAQIDDCFIVKPQT